MRKDLKSYCQLFWILLLTVSALSQSCQSDARNNTRIPPVVKKSKAQWQKDALQSLSDLISRGIDQDLNYFKRARIYFDLEQYSESLADINEAIDEQENVAEYFLLRGKVHREVNDLDRALEDAQRAEALQQNSPDLYVLLADILQEKGNFRGSGKYLSHAMQMAPYDASAYYVKAVLEARQGDSLASLNSLNYAMSTNPRLLRAYVQSTIINRKLGNFNQALIVNSKAIRRFPKMPELFFERGEIYNVLNQADTALIFYQKAGALNPNFVENFSKMADLELRQRYFYKAVSSLQQLHKIKPDYPKINDLLGLAYEKIGDYPKAREYYTVALTMDESDRDAHNGMWRMRRAESDPTGYIEEAAPTDYKLLDTSRVKINMIQPRKTINIKVDSSRKAKIQ